MWIKNQACWLPKAEFGPIGIYLLLLTLTTYTGPGCIYTGSKFIIFNPPVCSTLKLVNFGTGLKWAHAQWAILLLHGYKHRCTLSAHLKTQHAHTHTHTQTVHCTSTSKWSRLRNLKENKQDSRAVRCGVRLLDWSTKRGLFAAYRSIPANRTGSGTLLT